MSFIKNNIIGILILISTVLFWLYPSKTTIVVVIPEQNRCFDYPFNEYFLDKPLGYDHSLDECILADDLYLEYLLDSDYLLSDDHLLGCDSLLDDLLLEIL